MKRLVLLIALLGCAACTKADADVDTATVKPLRVRTELLAASPKTRIVTATGTIESVHDVQVAAETAGRVIRRLLPEGTPLEIDAGILAIDDVAARLRHDLARVAAEEAALAPDLPAAERSMRRIEEKLAADALRRCTVSSPINGKLERWYVDAGDWVTPGTVVARVVDYGRLRAFVELSGAEVIAVKPGSPVQVTSELYGDRGFEAKVERVFNASESTGKFRAEIALTSSEHFVHVGSTIRVRIELGGGELAVVVPKAAIFRRFEENFCFVAETRDGRLEARERRLETAPLLGDPTRLEITKGLAAGDRLILPPFAGVVHGAAIEAYVSGPGN